MSDHSSLNELLKDFRPSTKEQWTALAKKELGDQDPFETLTQVSTDGLHIKPYYDKTDLNPEALRGFQLASDNDEFKGARSWDNLPPVQVNDESIASKKALQYLTAGAEGILFDLNNKEQVDFDKLLTGIALEYCNVSFITDSAIHASDYLKYLEESGANSQNIRGSFFWKESPNDIIPPPSYHKIHWHGISVPVSTPIGEIGNALLMGNQQVQNLLKSDWKIDQAISSIAFSIGIETDFFVSIAKLKALRFLWFQITQAYSHTNFKPEDLYIHARSEAWINADFQPHGNMLKETTAAMTAVLGGTNGLSVYPEDLENEVMSRIALNTSNILREESHLNKVADPLAGSYFVENMVMEMAEKAWTKFQSSI